MYISINEAAGLLKVNIATLNRWVQKGMLNCHRTEEEITIDREELVNFIKRTGFSPIEFEQIDEDEEAMAQEVDERLLLTRAINRGVFTKLSDPIERNALFSKAVDLLAYVNEINFPRNLLTAKLIEREDEISTALTGGIALPHPKNSTELHFEKSIVCTVFLQHPVKLNNDCPNEIDLLFFLFSKNPSEHLKLLSTIARLVNANPELKNSVANTESRKDLVTLFKQYESRLLKI